MRNPNQRHPGRRLLVPGFVIGVTLAQGALASPDDQGTTQAATPKPVDAPMAGAQVYNEVCVACHSPPGFGGAPALGDSAAWAARIDNGMDTLIDHALNGYSGSTGIMPKKGGRTDLSDEEIIAAVEYMVKQAAVP